MVAPILPCLDIKAKTTWTVAKWTARFRGGLCRAVCRARDCPHAPGPPLAAESERCPSCWRKRKGVRANHLRDDLGPAHLLWRAAVRCLLVALVVEHGGRLLFLGYGRPGSPCGERVGLRTAVWLAWSHRDEGSTVLQSSCRNAFRGDGLGRMCSFLPGLSFSLLLAASMCSCILYVMPLVFPPFVCRASATALRSIRALVAPDRRVPWGWPSAVSSRPRGGFHRLTVGPWALGIAWPSPASAQTYPPTKTKVVSDVDLCTVSFDSAGLIQSYTYGLMVEQIANVENPVGLPHRLVFWFSGKLPEVCCSHVLLSPGGTNQQRGVRATVVPTSRWGCPL